MSVAAISCIFGKQFSYVYQAPLEFHSYFFTNNKELKKTITDAGWKYMFIDFPLSNDSIESSVQSKYIKFLQFLEPEHILSSYSYIFYADHKRKITQYHINQYITLQQSEQKLITLCSHEKPNRILQNEINESMLQERYKKNMNLTLELIKKHNISLQTILASFYIIQLIRFRF